MHWELSKMGKQDVIAVRKEGSKGVANTGAGSKQPETTVLLAGKRQH